MLDFADGGFVELEGVLIVLVVVTVLCRNWKDYRGPENQQQEKAVSFHGYAPRVRRFAKFKIWDCE
jgi:hypothetical protein